MSINSVTKVTGILFVLVLFLTIGCDRKMSRMQDGVATGPIAWSKCCIPVGQPTAEVLSSPAIDDIDADGKVEVVVAGSQGIYLFDLDAAYSSNPELYPWPTFHRDNQRTGCATPPPAPVCASIQGCVRLGGSPVQDAKVYIAHNDGSPVYVPGSAGSVERSYVLTTGTTEPNEARKGAFCINQLPPNSTYKLTIEVTGQPTKVVSDIAVTTGLVRVDVDL